MDANLGTQAYRGYLRDDAATISEHLHVGGYRSSMSEKRHVGGDFTPRDTDSWRVGALEHPTPRQRGFDRFFGILDGATHFFSTHFIFEDDSRVETYPDIFFFTDAIATIEESVRDAAPFFLYLAHAAPIGRFMPTPKTSLAMTGSTPKAGTPPVPPGIKR